VWSTDFKRFNNFQGVPLKMVLPNNLQGVPQMVGLPNELQEVPQMVVLLTNHKSILNGVPFKLSKHPNNYTIFLLHT
jgi:isoprenylcysteine carboxyl methyltransferase (ICMT) family protein YpbQ